MSSIRNAAAAAAAAVAAAVLAAACSTGPHGPPVASSASRASAAAHSPAAQPAAHSPAAQPGASSPAARAPAGSVATAPAGSPGPMGRLTMKQAELAYVRIVGPGNALANKLARASSGSAPFSEFRTDALAYSTELRAEISKFHAVSWPRRVRSRITVMITTDFPADIGCLQAMAAAGSTAASQAVGDSNHDCMVADNSTIPGTLQSMLSQ